MKIMKRNFGKSGVYFMALKLALWNRKKILLLRDKRFGLLDLPGGRADDHEYEKPLEKILAREVREELGPNMRYVLGEPLFHFKRAADPAFAFLAVYDAQWRAGEVELSSEHSSYEWIDMGKFRLKRSDFGQEEEYRAFKKYFADKNHA